MADWKTTLTGRVPQMVLGYLVGAACLYWVFHNVNLHQLVESMAGIRWWRVPAAIALDLLTYLCVALEWQYLLRPVGPVSFWRMAQATLAGRFTNDVLPVQMGYLVRIYLASRWMQKDLTAVVPSLLVERLLDSFWLATGIILLTLFIPLPQHLLLARDILAGVVLGATLLLMLVTLRRHRHPQEPSPASVRPGRWHLLEEFQAFLKRMAAGVRTIGRSPGLLAAVIGLSILKLFLQALAYFSLMWAYGLQASIWVGLGVFLIAYLGITVPSTPAAVGVFQFFSVLGLRIVGLPKVEATGFSLVAFVLLTAPLSVAGFVALSRSGVSLHQLREEASRIKERLKPR